MQLRTHLAISIFVVLLFLPYISEDVNKIIERFENAKHKPDLIIDAGILPSPAGGSKQPTVLDLTSSEPKILRVGPSRPEQLRKLLESMRS